MSLLKEYLLLCWFTNNPADLHPSKSFMWNCVAFYLISGIIVEANISDPADATLEVAMRAIVALILIAALVLTIKETGLFKQLLTAIFVCENFIVTLGIGAEILDYQLHATEYEVIPLYLGGVLILWYLGIIGYILKALFSFSWAACLLMALFYFTLTYGGPFLVMEVI